MLYTVTLLICLSTTPRTECTRDTAVSVTTGPERATAAMCSPLAQQYIARTVLLQPGRYLKTVCTPIGRLA